MRVFLALVLAATAAHAQAPPDSVHARRGDIYLAGVGGGLALAYVLAEVANTFDPDDDMGTTVAFAAAPVGAVLGVVVAGRLLGISGSTAGAVRGALRGSIYGLIAVPIALVLVGSAVSDGDGIGVLVASAAASAVLPGVLAARGYQAAPARLRTPGGAPAAGLVVRVRL